MLLTCGYCGKAMLSAWNLIQHIQSQHGLQLCSSRLEAGGSDGSHSLKDNPLAMAAATAAAARQLLHCSSNGLAGPHNLHHQLFPNRLIPVFEPAPRPLLLLPSSLSTTQGSQSCPACTLLCGPIPVMTCRQSGSFQRKSAILWEAITWALPVHLFRA